MSWLQDFHGPNAAFAQELYLRFLEDPDSVSSATRRFFRQATEVPHRGSLPVDKAVAAVDLVQAIRDQGHRAARLDPLAESSEAVEELTLAYHDLTEADLRQLPASIAGAGPASERDNAGQAVDYLRSIYCSDIGFDLAHLREQNRVSWLRKVAEARKFSLDKGEFNWEALLKRLTRVEVFEQFLHRIFPGRHRFSIEGVDVLVPMLDAVVERAQQGEMERIILGMAHRGRLNVMAHVLCRPYRHLIAKFKDPLKQFQFLDDLSWTGDVKYHQGAVRSAGDEGDQAGVQVTLSANPSHVEAVNPVVLGQTRAAGSLSQGKGAAEHNPDKALSVLIHGDAGFSGQGVVAETLNLARLQGYHVGGTLHVIANNQLGFTTEPAEYRSTRYASDLARGFDIPVIHVNADRPAACLEAIRIAWHYRQRFHEDILVNVIGYRRYGHNEGDEPAFTQPLMYSKISEHPTARQILARELIEKGVVDEDQPESMRRTIMAELQAVYEGLEVDEEQRPEIPAEPSTLERSDSMAALEVDQLAQFNRELTHLPEGFTPHPKLEKVLDRRQGLFEEGTDRALDWATAEQLALAAILADGTPIRMTGEDVERGTFSQRHAVLHDHRSGETFTPLQSFDSSRAAFSIHNSPLTENAVLAFEYGYNLEAADWLVIWEAQYGDFANGAQVPIDEFISAARAKWGKEPSLILLLPHGYEGAGPDHSSARVERFLQLAVEDNMRVANCTTSAQYFNLLRQQAALLEQDPVPLVILTPKSLLRHPAVASEASRFSDSSWQPVISECFAEEPGLVKRLVVCSGKIAVDLQDHDDFDENREHLAIVRLELLSPFPAAELEQAAEPFQNIEECIWVQEEPQNMGPWPMLKSDLTDVLAHTPRYIGRRPSSSPAEGSSAWHKSNQNAIVELALGIRKQGTAGAVVEEG